MASSASSAGPPSQPLFTIPIEPQGSVVATEPLPKIYLLTFQSPPDNRLTPAFDTAFLTALDVFEQKYPRGVVVSTSGISKFYSNGLDLDSAMKDDQFFPRYMYPLWRRLVTYPMPTVALINGHAFAGGLITAMMHDYRVMNPHKGYLCMNEVDFGAPLMPPMSSIFRQKLRGDTYRNLVLEGKRFNALAALKESLVDALGGWSETVSFLEENQITNKGESGIYGRLKEEMWRETIAYLDRGGTAEQEDVAFRTNITDDHGEQGAKRVEAFYASSKAKL